jgi:hypothetical protein
MKLETAIMRFVETPNWSAGAVEPENIPEWRGPACGRRPKSVGQGKE